MIWYMYVRARIEITIYIFISDITIQNLPCRHRRLQSCVGTRARLGYAAFDAQLRKRIALHCMLYTVVCTCVSTWSEGTPRVFASGPCDMSTQCFEITRAMPGPAGAYACRQGTFPMQIYPFIVEHTCSTSTHSAYNEKNDRRVEA